ncbi:MAG: hypothetical protein WCT03_02340 [Candidatus Obscuribacterales bacterium]|jgi:tetratricopeptide (TPR) repeat protein
MKYSWTCPGCHETFELKKRVTLNKRTCNHCGIEITPEEIDRQIEARDKETALLYEQSNAFASGCLSKLVFFLVGAGILIYLGSLNSNTRTVEDEPSTKNNGSDTKQSTTNSIEPTVKEAEPITSKQIEENNTQPEELQAHSALLEPIANAGLIIGPSDGTREQIDRLIQAQVDGSEQDISKLIQSLIDSSSPETHSSSSVDEINKVGLAKLRQKDYEGAAESFSVAAQKDPSDSKLLSNLGFAQTYSGKLENAKENLYQSLFLAPKREVAWDDLGQVFAKNNDQEKAVACFLVAYRISEGKTLSYLQSLGSDEDIRIQQAGATAIKKLTAAEESLPHNGN